MTLRIATSRALTTYQDRAALVRAVAAAQPEGELDWIEWKIGGNLADGPTRVPSPGTFWEANRLPERAALHAGGWGYLIMGAQPGGVPGITRVDPADLGQGVQSWLGTQGPAWWPHYDEETGVPVLIITVAAPKSGQRAFTLNKNLAVTTPAGASKTYPAGTIFVRHPGRTEIAGLGDIPALEDRYAAPALESARAAEANTRRATEIQQERLAAEKLERRRTQLLEIANLVIGAPSSRPLRCRTAATTFAVPSSSSCRPSSPAWITRKYSRRCQRSGHWPEPARDSRHSLQPSRPGRRSRSPSGT